MKSELTTDKMPAWQKDFQIDGSYFLMLLISAGNLLSKSIKPVYFWNDVLLAVAISGFVGALISIFYLWSIKKKLMETREIRLARLEKGWNWRVQNNVRVFIIAGIVLIALRISIDRLLYGIVQPFWLYAIICLLVASVYGLFFTITTTILDFRARKLSNS